MKKEASQLAYTAGKFTPLLITDKGLTSQASEVDTHANLKSK